MLRNCDALFSGIFVEWSSKERHLYEIEISCFIINDLTVTFDQFHASLLNKSINLVLIKLPFE